MKYMEDQLDLPLKDVLQILQNRLMNQSSYFGIKTLKSPTDFWIYQEIIFDTKPDFIIEIGNFCGGGALALAHICDAIGKGNIICLDIENHNLHDLAKEHPRITFITGDACELFETVKSLVGDAKVMIIEDSSHTFENTLNVLDIYSQLVKPGDYFIVEDGICHHGLDVGPNPGPYEAIEAFIEKNKSFVVDRSKESFLLTWNPKGYLKRVN